MSIDNYLKVAILKMEESSGNEMFFVRLVRVDTKGLNMLNEGVLEVICWQTKYFDKTECMERAWFDASEAAHFLGHEDMDKVELINMTNEEIETIKKFQTFMF